MGMNSMLVFRIADLNNMLTDPKLGERLDTLTRDHINNHKDGSLGSVVDCWVYKNDTKNTPNWWAGHSSIVHADHNMHITVDVQGQVKILNGGQLKLENTVSQLAVAIKATKASGFVVKAPRTRKALVNTSKPNPMDFENGVAVLGILHDNFPTRRMDEEQTQEFWSNVIENLQDIVNTILWSQNERPEGFEHVKMPKHRRFHGMQLIDIIPKGHSALITMGKNFGQRVVDEDSKTFSLQNQERVDTNLIKTLKNDLLWQGLSVKTPLDTKAESGWYGARKLWNQETTSLLKHHLEHNV